MFSVFVWLILLELCSVIPKTICSQGRDRELNFPNYYVFPDRRLIKHKIKTMHAKDLDNCELLCYQHDNCVSINIKNDPDITTGQQECELNNSTHMEHDEDLTVDNAYLYRGAKNACGKNPSCQNNAICQSGFTGKGYRCLCYLGFTGEHCDEDINECSSVVPYCSPDATCYNTKGSYRCICKPGFSGDGKECEALAPPTTCKEIHNRKILNESVLVTLNIDSQLTPVYCHMGNFGCGDGGWTPVMKIDGNKDTFVYDSGYWSDKNEYNLLGGETGFDMEEAKLPTYWDTPFSKICLGMKIPNQIKFIVINKQASSLYALIADGEYRATTLGRDTWKSLIGSQASLQTNCNKEGFNAGCTSRVFSKARIGTFGNNEEDCGSCNSRIGFGSGPGNPCGNLNTNGQLFGWHSIKAMGYILVQ